MDEVIEDDIVLEPVVTDKKTMMRPLVLDPEEYGTVRIFLSKKVPPTKENMIVFYLSSSSKTSNFFKLHPENMTGITIEGNEKLKPPSLFRWWEATKFSKKVSLEQVNKRRDDIYTKKPEKITSIIGKYSYINGKWFDTVEARKFYTLVYLNYCLQRRVPEISYMYNVVQSAIKRKLDIVFVNKNFDDRYVSKSTFLSVYYDPNIVYSYAHVLVGYLIEGLPKGFSDVEE